MQLEAKNTNLKYCLVMVKPWKSLPRDVLACPPLEFFKTQLGQALCKLRWL